MKQYVRLLIKIIPAVLGCVLLFGLMASAEEPEGTDLFEQLPQEFYFSSGAGAWATTLTLHPDGTFAGSYYDSDMGDIGDEYPYGTVYTCEFDGKFTEPEKIDEFTYSVEVDSLKTKKPAGETYCEDEIRYICSEPYGFEDAGKFLIYLPGCPLETVEEGFLSWAHVSREIRETLPAGLYGLYNPGGNAGFVGMADDAIWNSYYSYGYEDNDSYLTPVCSGESSLVFWKEAGGEMALNLEFAWSSDEQTEFTAHDSGGTGEYQLSFLFSDDHSSVTVSVTSAAGYDMTPWGGTAGGQFQAEYLCWKETEDEN